MNRFPKSGISSGPACRQAGANPLFGLALTNYAHAESVQDFVNNLKNVIITPLETLFILLSTFFFLWGIVQYIAGASSEEARTTGKNHMIWGIIGLVIIFSVQAIIAILKNFFT